MGVRAWVVRARARQGEGARRCDKFTRSAQDLNGQHRLYVDDAFDRRSYMSVSVSVRASLYCYMGSLSTSTSTVGHRSVGQERKGSSSRTEGRGQLKSVAAQLPAKGGGEGRGEEGRKLKCNDPTFGRWCTATDMHRDAPWSPNRRAVTASIHLASLPATYPSLADARSTS